MSSYVIFHRFATATRPSASFRSLIVRDFGRAARFTVFTRFFTSARAFSIHRRIGGSLSGDTHDVRTRETSVQRPDKLMKGSSSPPGCRAIAASLIRGCSFRRGNLFSGRETSARLCSRRDAGTRLSLLGIAEQRGNPIRPITALSPPGSGKFPFGKFPGNGGEARALDRSCRLRSPGSSAGLPRFRITGRGRDAMTGTGVPY